MGSERDMFQGQGLQVDAASAVGTIISETSYDPYAKYGFDALAVRDVGAIRGSLSGGDPTRASGSHGTAPTHERSAVLHVAPTLGIQLSSQQGPHPPCFRQA